MRGQHLIDYVTDTIKNLFDEDVAKAFTSRDEDTFVNLARHLQRTYGEHGIAKALEKVGAEMTDDTADWLVERAENPAAWLYDQTR